MLHGVFPALPTPFSEDGCSVQTEKIKPLCDALLADGVDGFFICGTTGEGPYLNASEKIAVVEETIHAVDGRAKILVQVGGGDLPGTLQVIKTVTSMKIDAVSLLQPWFFHCDEEAQYQYIARIAETLDGFPLYLYNLPCFSGNNLQPAVLERLRKQFPNIHGLKESGDPELLERWQPYQSDAFQVICGNDTQMLPTLRRGGYAVVASTANVIPHIFRKLLDAARDGQWDEAERCQKKISEFVSIIIGPNAIAYIKACLAFKGLDAGSNRPPNRNLSAVEKEALREKLKETGIIP
ncbi:MAG: dihydrodipicolinate synthase family protein [Candidatus Omnitrophica bacterium]|nr:dihydrodipicolinate synthase family protein [Candidatus Omnitrophota bacterium]